MHSQPFYLLSRELDAAASVMASFPVKMMRMEPVEQFLTLSIVGTRVMDVLSHVADMSPDMKVWEIMTVHRRVDQIKAAVKFWTEAVRANHTNN